MPRRREPLTGDPHDPQGMIALMEQFFEWMLIRNYSQATVDSRRIQLGDFINWSAARGVVRPNEVSKLILERYQRHLYLYRKHNGDPLSFASQNGCLISLRAWFKWLARNNHILYNPAYDLDMPKKELRLPKHILSISEMEQVLNQATPSTPLGIRDRAILETFYSCGLRRKELVTLRLYDLDTERGTIVVRQGKGRKDRMIPIGERAVAWIDRYAVEVRPGLLVGEASDVLFLTHLGQPFTPSQMTHLAGDYVNAAHLGKKGSCHIFRHTMATQMLENGADIRYIQAILGHERLETTQIYARVSIRKLKEVHTKTHPARGIRQQRQLKNERTDSSNGRCGADSE